MANKSLEIKKASYNNEPIWNRLLDLAKKRDILVDIVNLNGSSLNGFFFKDLEIQCIVLSSRIKGTKRNFVFAHELGHSVLHVKGDRVVNMFASSKDKIKKSEAEANRFADKLISLISRHPVKNTSLTT